jgi:hypothetical protein
VILRTIQDSAVSNTPCHPQFGEAVAILVTVIPVVLKMSTMQELLEKLGSVATVWRLGVPAKCRQHPEAGSTFARKQ